MSQSSNEEFSRYILEKYSVPAGAPAKNRGEKAARGDLTLRSILESSALPAGDFANEVARFWALPRLTLAQLLAAPAIAGKFSRRFLLESTIFPFEAGGA